MHFSCHFSSPLEASTLTESASPSNTHHCDDAFKMSACLSCADMSAMTHSPASLVFLCALLFLLSVSGGGAAKPVDEDKEWGQSTSLKFGLFSLRRVTFRYDFREPLWLLPAKVPSSDICYPPKLKTLVCFTSQTGVSFSLSFSDLVRRQLKAIFLPRLCDMRSIR